jgi:hypothetical protein
MFLPQACASILPMRTQSNYARLLVRARFCLFLLAAFFTSGPLLAQASMEVEPGLTIPDSKTPWALETYQGNRQLVPIHHSDVIVNQHAGANFAGSLAGSFFYKPKMTSELNGLNSRNQLHSESPVIYLLMDEDQDEGGDGKSSDSWSFIIVRAEQEKDKRIVDRIAVTQISGSVKRKTEVIDADVTQLPNHWYRIQPKAGMSEGEYALLPVWKAKGTSSTVVWDFGINLSAPNEKDAIVATRN